MKASPSGLQEQCNAKSHRYMDGIGEPVWPTAWFKELYIMKIEVLDYLGGGG